MSAVAIVSGAVEVMQLVDTLLSNAQQANAALLAAQQSGQPINLQPIQAAVAQAEQAALAAIATDPNSG